MSGEAIAPWTQWRAVRTFYLAVPQIDWAAVLAGTKTEFRHLRGGRGERLSVRRQTPTPVFLYTKNFAGVKVGAMRILESIWVEQMMSISPESLANEGCANIEDFKRYWRLRHARPFPALENCIAFKVSPWDRERAGQLVLNNLFGELLDEAD